jgi:ABC-type Zn uptake system ZnuABC Zn-binding protein ZnuA
VRAGLAGLIAAAALAAGCADPSGAGDDGRLQVVATTALVADLAHQVGGDRVDVTTLVPAGADPHDFSPSAADVRDVAEADVVIESGAGFDDWIDETIDNAGGEAEVIDASAHVRVVDGDPHVFGDAQNGIAMTQGIAAGLALADASHADRYRTRGERYVASLERLDGWIRRRIETLPPARRKLVTNHDAFGYYARAYGLDVVGAVIPSVSSAAQPSAGELADLVDTIRDQHVPVIFTEATIDPAVEERLAEEAGVEVEADLYADGPASDGPASTYAGMLRWNTAHIVAGLSP